MSAFLDSGTGVFHDKCTGTGAFHDSGMVAFYVDLVWIFFHGSNEENRLGNASSDQKQ